MWAGTEGGEWTDPTPGVKWLARFWELAPRLFYKHLLASFPISVEHFSYFLSYYSLQKEANILLLKSSSVKTLVLLLTSDHLNTYMDTCRQSEDVNKPHSHHFSSLGSSQSGWPPLALVDGSCCSCPYLVWRRSSTLRPWRSNRHIPATIDLDGTQDSQPWAC